MEVLFVSHKHPPSIGGIQAQNKALVDGVARHVKTHRLIWDGREPLALFLARVPWRVRQRLREHPQISAIHLCDGLMGAAALPVKRMCDVPVVLTLHGLDVVIPSELYRRWVVERFNAYDAIVAVSRDTARAAVERGIAAEKVHVVTNGIDERFFRAQRDASFLPRLEQRIGRSLHGARLLVHVGRAVKRKGLSWFLEQVLPALADDVVFLMVGPRDARKTERLSRALRLLPSERAAQLTQLFAWPLDEPAIKAALRSPALRGRAFELGALSTEELLQTLLHADLFVMPNLAVQGDREGFGLVAVEAGASGAPVLASALEGLEDAICDGENGWLLPPGDPARWVCALRSLLADAKARAELGQSAARHARLYATQEQMVHGYLRLFRALSEERAQTCAVTRGPSSASAERSL